MAHSIMGNDAEARKIQHEFVGDMETFADNMPVVGHIKSGVHMAMGDEEKAREVALSKFQNIYNFCTYLFCSYSESVTYIL